MKNKKLLLYLLTIGALALASCDDHSNDNNDKKDNTEEKETLSYTVTFDSNGGSAISNITVKENEKILKPTDPTKDGFDFVGWTLNGTNYDFNSTITENITLVATWNEKQTPKTYYKVTIYEVIKKEQQEMF